MRTKSSPVLYFDFSGEASIKVAQEYRAKYQAISDLLDANGALLALAHRDWARLLSTSGKGLAILDEGGLKLWDTGEVPTYGAATFDSVRFGVSSGEGSEIQWDAKQKSMRLVGVSKPEEILAGYVDNIKVSSFKR